MFFFSKISKKEKGNKGIDNKSIITLKQQTKNSLKKKNHNNIGIFHV
jgi:hypothetical protein